MAKGNKYTSFANQRESCRLDKKTYVEKINGDSILFCNYPFTDPTHKKGLCLARTCTDLRQIPKEVVDADVSGDDGTVKTEKGELACPSNE